MASFKPREVAIAAVVVALMVGGSLWRMHVQSASDAGDGDPNAFDPSTIVPAMRASNPGLTFEIGSDRGRTSFWVTEPSTGRTAAVPRDELPGATIRFVDCDPAAIGPALLYPTRTELRCLEIRNDKHMLSAYVYATRDPLARQIDFFERNVEPERREPLGGTRRTGDVHRTLRNALTREFILMYQLDDDGGFVGYREAPVPPR